MAKGPATFLFGDGRIATARGGRGRYAHTFGGPPDRRGASREECGGLLIHLLHRLDLTDPAVPVAVPGLRWLPVYYSFDFRTNDLGYRLLSDNDMVTFFPDDDPNVSEKESWPDEDYPPEFPKSAIAVEPHPYDPTDPDDAYRWAGVFGIGKLSERDQAAVRARVAEQWDLAGLAVPETDEEFADALCGPFFQGKPNGPCLNPECPNRTVRGELKPIAVVPAEPVPGVHTFGRWGGGLRLVVQMCPRCHTIRVTNEST